MPRKILEHDDAADEGDPKRCAPGGGETENMGEFDEGRELGRFR